MWELHLLPVLMLNCLHSMNRISVNFINEISSFTGEVPNLGPKENHVTFSMLVQSWCVQGEVFACTQQKHHPVMYRSMRRGSIEQNSSGKAGETLIADLLVIILWGRRKSCFSCCVLKKDMNIIYSSGTEGFNCIAQITRNESLSITNKSKQKTWYFSEKRWIQWVQVINIPLVPVIKEVRQIVCQNCILSFSVSRSALEIYNKRMHIYLNLHLFF